jgi:hypothetical protein
MGDLPRSQFESDIDVFHVQVGDWLAVSADIDFIAQRVCYRIERVAKGRLQ